MRAADVSARDDRSVKLTVPSGSLVTALSRSLRVHVAPRATMNEMPWIWRELRREVYARMPCYEQRQFSMTFEPVIVAGTFDTVPGVGVGGVF